MIGRASKRLEYVRSQLINEDNSPFLFEDIYEVMRECIHCLMAANGYKPYSHEATVAFLEEYYKSYFGEKLVEAFNRYRIIRNNMLLLKNVWFGRLAFSIADIGYPSHLIIQRS